MLLSRKRQPAVKRNFRSQGWRGLSAVLIAGALVLSGAAAAGADEGTQEADDPYGYLMVHFIEDPQGYAEKIHLSISRGDNPEQWDRLNGGEPVLASHLGTTGVRDPYLVQNPDTGTWYIVATDLRVFGGDSGSEECGEWCYWSSQGSTKLNIWQSEDLIHWSDLEQVDVALDAQGERQAELGMAWAPEATWEPDFYGEDDGAFVVYWSSNLYADDSHDEETYSRVMWAATKDFTQETWEYGGVMIDTGGNTIDTTVLQDGDATYRLTKDNSDGKGIYMERGEDEQWWLEDAEWETLQTEIGAGWADDNPGGVEGPAGFKRNDSDHWYLYVDVIPSIGYQPMETEDLDAGWEELRSDDFDLESSTKHGGIVSLTRAEYDSIREADAEEVIEEDAGTFEFSEGASRDDIRTELPAETEVSLAHDHGTNSLPVDWNLDELEDELESGTYEVTGTVDSLGANFNDWIGEDESSDWDAPDKKPRSDTELEVRATVEVAAGIEDIDVELSPRCIAGNVAVVATVSNAGDEAITGELSSSWGKNELQVDADGLARHVFSTRSSSVESGHVSFSDVTTEVDSLHCGN